MSELSKKEIARIRSAEYRKTDKYKAWLAKTRGERYKKIKNDPEKLAALRQRAKDWKASPRGRQKAHEKNRTPEQRAYQREYMRRYIQDPEEKARRAAYKKTPAGLRSNRKYAQSESFKAIKERWRKTPEGKARIAANHRKRAAIKNAGSITPKEIRAIKSEASDCHYCRVPFDSRVTKTTDHILPLSRGGAHSRENLVICCHSCNSNKARLTPEEWEARKRLLGI